jgi:hypothetical protein
MHALCNKAESRPADFFGDPQAHLCIQKMSIFGTVIRCVICPGALDVGNLANFCHSPDAQSGPHRQKPFVVSSSAAHKTVIRD